jgi:hypothetical protein
MAGLPWGDEYGTVHLFSGPCFGILLAGTALHNFNKYIFADNTREGPMDNYAIVIWRREFG